MVINREYIHLRSVLYHSNIFVTENDHAWSKMKGYLMIFLHLKICLLFSILNGLYVLYVVMKEKCYQFWDVSKVTNIPYAILMEYSIEIMVYRS